MKMIKWRQLKIGVYNTKKINKKSPRVERKVDRKKVGLICQLLQNQLGMFGWERTSFKEVLA